MSAKKQQIEKIRTEELHFDRSNPRLAEYGITRNTPEEDILKILWEAMDVKELVQSISASGFFPHEALIVAEENGKKIVIEGNRRLAAVKVMIDPSISKNNRWDISEIDSELVEELSELPAILSPREDSWRFLGFKHVNGAAKWTSYAKAKYIAHVHKEYGISLTDIAKQIGDGFGTVKKLYQGFMVLQQAERKKVYSLENRYHKRLSFSHLYTGIQYQGFKEFLSLDSENEETDSPVPDEKINQLGELCTWLYGDKSANKRPVIISQNPNLKQLNEIVQNKEALITLRDTNDIDRAFELTHPATEIFEEALLRAKRELLRAKSYIPTGYDRSEGLLRTAGTIVDTAESIYEEMERMRVPEKKKRLTEES